MMQTWEIGAMMGTDKLRSYLERACEKGMFNWLPDKQFLYLMYWARMGARLHLRNPQTFNEKLQWLKLYDRKAIYTQMVDKYEAKGYIASVVGEEYTIETLGVWERFEEIDWNALPNQFVLKCTHDSGGLVVVRDKNNLDVAAAKAKIEQSLKRNYYLHGREWPYKNVKPRIIAEKFLEDTADDALTDYKFFCYHGIPRIMYISKDRGNQPRTDFFDMEFNHLPIQVRDQNAEVTPQKPEQFERMKQIAGKLSEGIPHLRVDFYLVDGKIYIGELTFFHTSGFTRIRPEEWNLRMGSWIELPR